MRSVLITGGSGSFGKAFTRHLFKSDVERICILSRCEVRQAEMASECGNDRRIRFFIGDVRNKDRLRRAMEGVEVVVHAAALKRIEVGHYNPDEMAETNIDGARNVIWAAHEAGVKKVVALSTDKAFAPISMYGASKLAAECLFLGANHTRGSKGPRFSVTRYGNVWGSRGSVVPKWQGLLAVGKHIEITDPECTRFFMRMGEAIDLVLDTIGRMPTEVAIPRLPAYRLGDIPIAMGIPATRIHISGLPRFEKRHESMSEDQCSETAPRLTIEDLRVILGSFDTKKSPTMNAAAG